MQSGPTLVWFRRDLRLADNPALTAAVARGGPVVPVFIWAPEEERPWQPGAASRWWLHHSLLALDAELRKRGLPLVIEQGASLKNLQELIRTTGATAVFWNRLYEPALRPRDKAIIDVLQKDGIETKSFGANLLFEPERIANKSGHPFQVFTPFWKCCLAEPPPTPPLRSSVPAFKIQKQFSKPLKKLSLAFQALELLPKNNWAASFHEVWQPGEQGAHKLLKKFRALDYAAQRDFPASIGTTRLSPHLHFGEISPRQIWHAVPAAATEFRRQLVWREFAHHLLWHFPHTTERPLRADFARFPWDVDEAAFKAWQRGRTGFPIVDAGMRELWQTGWMHNRVRMIAASFLVKDLRLSWLDGARWFWDTLVDADLANNTLGWQWVAGCGADAAPYFRVFNPALQQKKFDPAGKYVRRWLPKDGEDYPAPMVDHDAARLRALEAYGRMRITTLSLRRR